MEQEKEHTNIARLPAELLDEIAGYLEGSDAAACRQAGRLFCTRSAAWLAARHYEGRPCRLVASCSPLEAIVSVFTRWGIVPSVETIKDAARAGRLDVVRWAEASVTARFYTPDRLSRVPDRAQSGGTGDVTPASSRRALTLGEVALVEKAAEQALRHGHSQVAFFLLCQTQLLEPDWCVGQVQLVARVTTAPWASLEIVTAVVDACRRRVGWVHRGEVALSHGAFCAMEAGRVTIASWLHAQPEVTGRAGGCRCRTDCAERAFGLQRIDWLRWLDAVGCRGRYQPNGATLTAALRVGGADFVRWAAETVRAAGIPFVVDERALTKAMRDGRYESLVALDHIGIAPFASWPSMLAAVSNRHTSNVDILRCIRGRGGTCSTDVVVRAARAGRTDVLAYLFAECDASAAHGVAAASIVAAFLARNPRTERDSAAQGLAWLCAHVPQAALAVDSINDCQKAQHGAPP
jgi:hypothetical protein